MQKTFVKTQSATLTALSLRLLGWLLLLLPTLALAAALPTVSRVKDINTTPGGSNPAYFVKVGNLTFFTAVTPTTGRELWKSDGTAAGTVLVKDINPGSDSAWWDYHNFTSVGNMVYFIANDGLHGWELWKSDGTAAGTVLVKDIYAGDGSAWWGTDPNFTAVGTMLYFTANNGITGYELWKSDGTAAGTVLVKDIVSGAGSPFCDYGYFQCYDSYFTAVGNVLYFRANNGVIGYELWKSDGTAAGTVLVKDINAGNGSAWYYHYDDDPNFTAVGTVLYFAADNGVTGKELWKSNGTAAGTVLVKDINSGSGSAWDYYGDAPNFTAVGNMLYFHAYDGVNGRELWKSDGTAAGTVLVKNIYAGSNSSSPYDFTTVGTVLYFSAYDSVNGSELWRSNGTAAGTVLVKDIKPGSDGSHPRNLTAVNNVLYFRAYDGVTGDELWKSNGTAVGTVLVKDINAGSGSAWDQYEYPTFTAVGVGNVLYFSANNGLNGSELWKSDGTAAGTVLVKDIYLGNDSTWDDYDYPNFTAVGNVLYFGANNGLDGWELWKSDGTTAGTVLVKDVRPEYLTAGGNMLYFTANNDVFGSALWKSDGTTAGTVLVKDINSTESLFCNNGFCFDPNLTTVGTMLYFVANDGVHGTELWKSNGTAAGTVLVKDINIGSGNAFNDYDCLTTKLTILTSIGNMLYFYANDGLNGCELWKSDGTAAGTVMVKDINVGSSGSIPHKFTVVGNVLYFLIADDDDMDHGLELWKSNGTAAGTVLVKDNIWAYDLTVVGTVLYFIHGDELWKSDGTAAGTVLVKDINPENNSLINYYSNLTAMDNVLYFVADNGTNGKELWKSNGTAAGTVLVKDINSGSGSAWGYYVDPNFTAVGNMLYFQANNGVNGDELWQTDGTTAGTQMKELVPGWGGSGPAYLTALGTRLYFSAVDNATGRELWRADIPNLFTVTPSANIGGVVSPNISQAVAPNGSLKFTVTPLPTYNRNPTVGGTCPRGSWSAGAISAPSVWTTGAITANCTVVFGFISTLPDFVVTTITLNPVTPVRNSTFTATVTVKNQGAMNGDGKFLDVWSHQPLNQACGATGTKRVTVGTLTAGQSKTFNITSLPAGTAGAKTLRAFVDSGCGTRESNEANNQMTKAYTVQ